VDARAKIVSRFPDGDSVRVLVEAPPELAQFIAPKGSVALNGVSLTVNEVDGQRFGVNIIPYTLTHTTWGDCMPGDLVNLEVDLLARYVARLRQHEGPTP
jgi:riboflavin synthase